MLEYHTHMLADLIDVGMRIGDILAVKNDLAGGRHFQKIHAAQEGRFTGTGRPDDNHLFSRCNMLVDIFEDMVVAKRFCQILNGDHSVSSSSLLCQEWLSGS